MLPCLCISVNSRQRKSFFFVVVPFLWDKNRWDQLFFVLIVMDRPIHYFFRRDFFVCIIFVRPCLEARELGVFGCCGIKWLKREWVQIFGSSCCLVRGTNVGQASSSQLYVSPSISISIPWNNNYVLCTDLMWRNPYPMISGSIKHIFGMAYLCSTYRKLNENSNIFGCLLPTRDPWTFDRLEHSWLPKMQPLSALQKRESWRWWCISCLNVATVQGFGSWSMSVEHLSL